MMRRMLLVSFAAGSLAAGAAHADPAADIALFGKDPGKDKAYACYVRHYDKAHLASHPRQNVRDMTLFVSSTVDADSGRQYSLEIGVHFRSRKKLFELAGGCDTTINGASGISCGIDCDGGEIDVKVKNATSVLVSIPYGARTWDPETEKDPPPRANFASDDKLFRLDRTSLRDCLPIIGDDDTRAEVSKLK